MTIGDGDPVFLDTNILVYSGAIQAPFHTLAREAVQALERTGVDLWISRQILREYLAVFTRPQSFVTARPMSLLIADVRHFDGRFHVAEDGPDVTSHLLTLLAQIPVGGRQIHDANIVATMQAHGIPRLLTHNTDDFARYAGLITVLPLVPAR